MKTAIKYTLAACVVVLLAACGQKEAVIEVPTPPIPTLSVSEIIDMSKNERQELERRCLGVSHETCSNLKSDSFQKRKDLRIAMCKAGASYTGLSDRNKAAREERKCDEMF